MTALEEITQAIETLERLRAESTDGAWEYTGEPFGDITTDQAGSEVGSVVAESADKYDGDLIVTLHRTIDAQLAILRREGEFALKFGWPEQPFPERLDVLTLARAINGATS